MKHMTTLLLAASLIALASPAHARNDQLKLPIADAMSAANANGKLNSSVKFYFSGQKTPHAKQTMGTFTANKKTNALNKTDKGACEWAFTSAILALQSRALREGGNAVVDIHSVYKDHDLKSATEYECGAGVIMAGVALRGTVVKLR